MSSATEMTPVRDRLARKLYVERSRRELITLLTEEHAHVSAHQTDAVVREQHMEQLQELIDMVRTADPAQVERVALQLIRGAPPRGPRAG